MEEIAEGSQEVKNLYIISKKSGSCRELKNINNIRAKASKKRSDSYSDESYYDSSLSRKSN